MEKVMYVYIVRWMHRIGSRSVYGDFESCYKDEHKAAEVMLNDFHGTSECVKRLETSSHVYRKDDGTPALCVLRVKNDTHDYYEWCVEKIKVIE